MSTAIIIIVIIVPVLLTLQIYHLGITTKTTNSTKRHTNLGPFFTQSLFTGLKLYCEKPFMKMHNLMNCLKRCHSSQCPLAEKTTSLKI